MNQKNKLSSDNESQRQRLMAYLLANHSINTLEARKQLDVFHPAGRIKELKDKEGYNIVTTWEHIETDKGEHRIGRYTLLAGIANHE